MRRKTLDKGPMVDVAHQHVNITLQKRMINMKQQKKKKRCTEKGK